ncbi:MAG TPA: glucosamine-6-phosphate deaminase [Acidimicrobiia bacterium]
MRLEVLPAAVWAATVAETLSHRLRSRPHLRLCLATGRTPTPVYAALGADTLTSATVILLDEFGGLPPGHPARCETMLRAALRSGVKPRKVIVPEVDRPDLAAACRDFDRAIGQGGIDLAILGLGRNGHLGMNEPGSSVSAPTRVIRLAPETRESARGYGADPVPDWGITAGLNQVLAAGEVWLLVTGSHKSAILKQTLEGPIGPDVPATYLRDHPAATVWADADAAAGMSAG